MNTPSTPAAFAALLDGRTYGREITHPEIKLAKASGLVVVMGCSDDLCELRGAIDDEVACHNGGPISFLRSGHVFTGPDRHEHQVLKKYGVLESIQKNTASFTALWGAHSSGPSWTYQASFPHATFRILHEGLVYCVGIVFRLEAAFTGCQPGLTAPPTAGTPA